MDVQASPLAYLALLPSSILWVLIAAGRKDLPLMAMSATFSLINVVGCVRWLS